MGIGNKLYQNSQNIKKIFVTNIVSLNINNK